MKERPILFSAPMVRAILAGTKTQTRRIVSPQPDRAVDGIPWTAAPGARSYGVPSDRLWVRETFALEDCGEDGERVIWRADRAARWDVDVTAPPFYLPSAFEPLGGWRPSIFMPRAASRIDLEIEAVRIERLQDITENDARAEGVTVCTHVDLHAHTFARSFACLWDTINGKRAPWASTPWVWVITFKRVRP